jgi:hypothetical protein
VRPSGEELEAEVPGNDREPFGRSATFTFGKSTGNFDLLFSFRSGFLISAMFVVFGWAHPHQAEITNLRLEHSQIALRPDLDSLK